MFPVHNEAGIIEHTLRNYVAELAGRIHDVEFIVAEDGSTDGTKAVLERLARELPIRVYICDERKGYQQAVIEAISQATKPWIFAVDSDYQFEPIDYWALDPHRQTHDIILGIKSPRRDPWYRIFLSWCYNRLLKTVFDVPYDDMDTGFRLFRRSVFDEVAGDIRHMSFFTAEFVVRSHYAGHRIKQVPVPHYARKAGSTTIFFLSKLFVICFVQLIGIINMRREFNARGLRGAQAPLVNRLGSDRANIQP